MSELLIVLTVLVLVPMFIPDVCRALGRLLFGTKSAQHRRKIKRTRRKHRK